MARKKFGRRARAKSKTPKTEPVIRHTPVPKVKSPRFSLKKQEEKITPDPTVSKRTWLRKKRRK